MKIAHPPFSSRIGRIYPHAAGFATAYSEYTNPTGGLPINELKLSLPTNCHVLPLRARTIIS